MCYKIDTSLFAEMSSSEYTYYTVLYFSVFFMRYTQPDVYEFISQQTNDPIVEWKICRVSGTKFPIYQSDLDFYKKIRPHIAGQMVDIPTPTLCPEERQRRRMAWRNERSLFRRKCDATGKDIISMYPPDAPFPVYTAEVRRSDSWSGLDYGFTFDHTKTFTEQFKVLLETVPRLFMYNLKSENSDYSNCSSDMKNCYLVTAGLDCEDCYYGNYMYHCKDCVDNLMVFSSERMYSCVECTTCESCQYCYNTHRSRNAYFMTNCDTCEWCFGCVNLVGKKYCWFNEQLTKEEYEARLAKLQLGSWEQIKKIERLYAEFLQTFPRPANMSMSIENCRANYSITHSKNCSFSFDVTNVEDCKYVYRFRGGKDCYDVYSWGTRGERLYECVQVGDNVANCIACQGVDSESSFCYYSTACSNSHHCFGCNGLKNASYCIFNKQYTKETWEAEVARIIHTMQKTGEWGEMLDPAISLFGYNYSVAQEFSPWGKQQAGEKCYTWSDYIIPSLAANHTMRAQDLPDMLQDVDESICSQIIACEESGKLYRITKQEYLFYQKNNIPLPRKHADLRFMHRLAQRPPRAWYLRTCDKTGEEIISVYDPHVPFPVRSEEVYKQTIYG